MDTSPDHVVSLAGVSKDYGARRVLHDLSLQLTPGRIHALVGANGAGKSTALSIVAGLVPPSMGSVQVGGRDIRFSGRIDAISAGVGLVPQHLSLVPELTLVENLALTHQSTFVRYPQLRAQLLDAASKGGLKIRPDIACKNIGFAEKQLGELAIALTQGGRTLLLDEPTSSIGPFETGLLFERLLNLARDGVAILMVTHRIDEVRQWADDVTVLEQGHVRLQTRVDEVDDATLIRAMVGNVPTPETRKSATHADKVKLVLRDISAQSAHGQSGSLRGISLEVSQGEILGVIGIAGNGQNLLAEVAAGIVSPESGNVFAGDADITGKPFAALKAKVAHVPEERMQALLPEASLARSALLGPMIDNPSTRRFGILDWVVMKDLARKIIERHDVRPPDAAVSAGALSGGNAQKFLVGRELDGQPSVAVLHGPTQGLDIHAASAIRNNIRAAAEAGTGILLISADLDEVLELSDRVAVLSDGKIVDLFNVEEFDRDRVGRGMAGLLNMTNNISIAQ